MLQIATPHRQDVSLPALEVTPRSYYRARYYDVTTGRFVNEDPAGFNAGSPNFYVYVGNDPVDAADPFGLKCIRKLMLVTAYSANKRPGSDWHYYAQTRQKPSVGFVAVANTNPMPYGYGSSVSVSNNPDPFGRDFPLAGPTYPGTVHDTGAGWDYPGHVPVAPDDWIDIWLPKPAAKKWGRQWRWVTICTPDGCNSAPPNLFSTYKFGGNAFE
jgi:RHS repeat-associated protein